jgi:hypothetical protein
VRCAIGVVAAVDIVAAAPAVVVASQIDLEFR